MVYVSPRCFDGWDARCCLQLCGGSILLSHKSSSFRMTVNSAVVFNYINKIPSSVYKDRGWLWTLWCNLGWEMRKAVFLDYVFFSPCLLVTLTHTCKHENWRVHCFHVRIHVHTAFLFHSIPLFISLACYSVLSFLFTLCLSFTVSPFLSLPLTPLSVCLSFALCCQ